MQYYTLHEKPTELPPPFISMNTVILLSLQWYADCGFSCLSFKFSIKTPARCDQVRPGRAASVRSQNPRYGSGSECVVSLASLLTSLIQQNALER